MGQQQHRYLAAALLVGAPQNSYRKKTITLVLACLFITCEFFFFFPCRKLQFWIFLQGPFNKIEIFPVGFYDHHGFGLRRLIVIDQKRVIEKEELR